MNVIGLDLSLTRTGVATDDGTKVLVPVNTGMARLAAIRDEILKITGAGPFLASEFFPPADLVVIEGYSFGTQRQASHAHGLGELGGVVRLALWEAKVPYVDVPPACLKRYATGKGNANKGQVLEAASKRSGLDFGGDNNRADAWWLRQMGMAWAFDHALGLRPDASDFYIGMPAANRAALASVKWPSPAAVAS